MRRTKRDGMTKQKIMRDLQDDLEVPFVIYTLG